MPIYKILRTIPETFEVRADSFDDACDKINQGEAGESAWNEDRFELIEEIPDVKTETIVNQESSATDC